MLICESESVGCGSGKAQPPRGVAEEEEEALKDPSLGMGGQNSVFSLTLDEIQCKSGKSLGSMNMDEFLASVWDDPNSAGLGRQGSLSVPVTLSNKTVDEVWFEIHAPHQSGIQRQQTLGEITLEDFLVKAGVVQQPALPPNHIIHQHQHQHHVISPLVASGNGFLTYHMLTKSAGEPSVDPGGGKATRKRIIDGPPEVVVERRQRRMIKNRESAARSRARRQAYTVELELELNQLREENTKLKQILEDMDQKRKEEVMKRKQSKDDNKLMWTIRRTVSLGW